MRLFIAVNFSDEVKKKLEEVTSRCRQELSAGKLTRPENFHLTLVFLGETPSHRIPAIQQAIDAVSGFEPFTLSIEGIGRFKRKDGDILWADVRGQAPLCALQKQLCLALRQARFSTEEEHFRPHLTLARQAVYKESFESLKSAVNYSPIPQQVNRIFLMKSERLNGVLTYTPIG